MLNQKEITETLHMIDSEHLDIRTITMGVSLRSCAHSDPKIAAQKMYDKYVADGGKLKEACKDCGFCERRCPQHLQIRSELERVEAIFRKQ